MNDALLCHDEHYTQSWAFEGMIGKWYHVAPTHRVEAYCHCIRTGADMNRFSAPSVAAYQCIVSWLPYSNPDRGKWRFIHVINPFHIHLHIDQGWFWIFKHSTPISFHISIYMCIVRKGHFVVLFFNCIL